MVVTFLINFVLFFYLFLNCTGNDQNNPTQTYFKAGKQYSDKNYEFYHLK